MTLVHSNLHLTEIAWLGYRVVGDWPFGTLPGKNPTLESRNPKQIQNENDQNARQIV